MATLDQIQKIIKLFIGYFDRAPAPEGTNYWTGRLEAGDPLSQIAESFSVQPETTALYPIMITRDFSQESVAGFLNDVFMNVLGRPIQQPGLDYYSDQLAAGRKIGEIIIDIINGATSGTDKATIDNKVAVGVDFYNKTNAIPGYQFDAAALDAARDALADVTSDASTIAPAIAKNSAYIASLNETPTITLTVNADTPGATSPSADTSGDAGDNTYEGIVGPPPFLTQGVSTLNDGDNLAAGGGTDALNLRVVDLERNAVTVSPSASNLENIFVTVQDQNSLFTLDFASMAGEAQVWGVNSGPNAAFFANNVDMGTVAGLDDFDGLFVINYKGDRSGSDDAFSAVFRNGSGTASNPAVFATVQPNTSADNSFEIANLTVSGAASALEFGTMSLRDITVTGDSMLTLFEANNFSGLKTFDASGNSGGTNVQAFGVNATDFMFMGGDGMDRVALKNTLFNSANTLSLAGGGDKDTLAVNSWNVDPSTVNNATGFEVLENTSNSGTLDANDFTRIDEFRFEGARSSGRTTVEDIETDDRFVVAQDQRGSDEVLRFEGAVVGTDLTLEITQNAGSNGTVIESTANSSTTAAIGFTGNIGDVNLISTGPTSNANEILTQDNGSNNYFAFDNQGGIDDFTLTGDRDLTITARAGLTLDSSSDLRGFTNSVNFDASGFTGALRIAGSGTDDAIAGGSGNDIIYGMGGENQLTGNGGPDQFRFSDFNDDSTLMDFTIGTDKVGLFNGEVDFDNTTASAAGATLNSADYIENVSAIANLSAAEDDKLIELQTAASEDQITNNTAGASIEAYVLVFNTDSGKAELWHDADWSNTNNRDHIVTFNDITSLADMVGLSNTDFVEYVF